MNPQIHYNPPPKKKFKRSFPFPRVPLPSCCPKNVQEIMAFYLKQFPELHLNKFPRLNVNTFRVKDRLYARVETGNGNALKFPGEREGSLKCC